MRRSPKGYPWIAVPFKGLPPEQTKAAAVEYCTSKYSPSKADFNIHSPALLQFADEASANANAMRKADADGYLFEMI